VDEFFKIIIIWIVFILGFILKPRAVFNLYKLKAASGFRLFDLFVIIVLLFLTLEEVVFIDEEFIFFLVFCFFIFILTNRLNRAIGIFLSYAVDMNKVDYKSSFMVRRFALRRYISRLVTIIEARMLLVDYYFFPWY